MFAPALHSRSESRFIVAGILIPNTTYRTQNSSPLEREHSPHFNLYSLDVIYQLQLLGRCILATDSYSSPPGFRPQK